MIELKCYICGKKYSVFPMREYTSITCSGHCRGILVGKIKFAKRKPRLSTQGYYFILKPEHHRANKQGYTKVADIIMEKHLDRKLKQNEIIHHKNGIGSDDRLKNLKVMDRKDHDLMHLKESNKKRQAVWSYFKGWKHCQNCGDTKRKHMGLGLCSVCYKQKWYANNR